MSPGGRLLEEIRYIGFYDWLLEKSGKTTINVRHSPTLCVKNLQNSAQL